MRLIARNILIGFWDKHPETKVSLERWYQVAKAAHWTSTDDGQQAAPTVAFYVFGRDAPPSNADCLFRHCPNMSGSEPSTTRHTPRTRQGRSRNGCSRAQRPPARRARAQASEEKRRVIYITCR
jgi:hypothetical protein